MLTQTERNVNRENLHEKANSSASGLVLELRRLGSDIRRLTAARILEESNERAVDFIRSIGCDILIPETGFTVVNRIAETLGLNDEYVRHVASRNQLTNSKLPNDVYHMNFWPFLTKFACANNFVIEYQKHRRTDVWYLRKCPESYLFATQSTDSFYSARVFLAMVLLMAKPGTKSGDDTMVRDMQEAILKSAYATEAKTILAEAWLSEPNINECGVQNGVEERAESKEQSSALLHTNGNIELSPDFFSAVIKTAVKEAVSECMREFVPKTECPIAQELHTEPRRHPVGIGKFRKPQKWERISSMYGAGDISASEAAKMCGMSYETFCRYYEGLMQFRP